MDRQKDDWEADVYQTREGKRGFSLPFLSTTLPMPHVNAPKEEMHNDENVREKLDKECGDGEVYSE